MKFSVAYNWDPAVVQCAARLGMEELYCKFDRDLTGGARPSFALRPAGWSALRLAARLADARGITLNYVLNGVGRGAIAFTPAFVSRYRRLVGRLHGLGIRTVTLANPFLAEVAKTAHPDIRVVVSSLAHVASLPEAQFWERLGAERIVVEDARAIPLIRAIRGRTGLGVEVMANQLCWPSCPLRFLHAEIASDASATGSPTGAYYPAYCDVHCLLPRVSDPIHLVRAAWIRPQDLGRYEEWGATHVKLVERTASTEDLCRIMRAYRERRYDGDLVDLFPKMRPGPRRGPLALLRGTGLGRYVSLLDGRQLRAAFAKPPVSMDGAAFDGFLDFFATHDCRVLDCETCGHCRAYARRGVHLGDAEALRRRLLLLQRRYASGGIFDRGLASFVARLRTYLRER